MNNEIELLLNKAIIEAEDYFDSWIKSDEASELKKIGELCEICLDLLPKEIRTLLRQTIDNQAIADILIKNFLGYTKLFLINEIEYNGKKLSFKETKVHRSMIIEKMAKSFEIPKKISIDYNLKTWWEVYDKYYKGKVIDDFTGIIKLINERKKHKCYSSLLIEIVRFIIEFDFYSCCSENDYGEDFRNFRYFHFIAEIFIEMGAIDAALKLYAIDENIFNNPNTLSLVANNALKTGDLNSASKLVKNLINREPYHPSISALTSELKRLEQRKYLATTALLDVSKINELSGIEFENLLMDKFIVLGFKVESTPKTKDFGADLIIENKEGSRIIVQCKRFKTKVNLKAVQEVVGAIGHYAGDMGIVITNNSFLNSAVKLAESNDIELWDGDKLVSFLIDNLSFSKIADT